MEFLSVLGNEKKASSVSDKVRVARLKRFLVFLIIVASIMAFGSVDCLSGNYVSIYGWLFVGREHKRRFECSRLDKRRLSVLPVGSGCGG